MPYTLKRSWRDEKIKGGAVQIDEVEGGESLAEAVYRATSWWDAVTGSTSIVLESTRVDIRDEVGRSVGVVKERNRKGPIFLMASEDPTRKRWLEHMLQAALIAPGLRRSVERLDELGSHDLTYEIAQDVMDACAMRVSALSLRVDEMTSRGLMSMSDDAEVRSTLRNKVEECLGGPAFAVHENLGHDGRIPVPPSTVPDRNIDDRIESLLAVSRSLIEAYEALETFARTGTSEPRSAPKP